MKRLLLLLWVGVVSPVFGSLCAHSLNEQGALMSVKYTRNGEYVVTGVPLMVRLGNSGFALPLLDVRSRTLLSQFGYAGESAVLSKDETYVAYFRSGMLSVVETATQKELFTDIDRSHPGNVAAVAFDSTAKRLAIVTSEPYAAIHVLEMPSGRSLVRHAQFGESDYTHVRWSHDDRFLITVDRKDNDLTLWEVNPKQTRPNERPREIREAKRFRFASLPCLSQNGLLVGGAVYHEEPYQKAAEFGVWQIFSGKQSAFFLPPDRLGFRAQKASFVMEKLFSFDNRAFVLARWSVPGTRSGDLELYEALPSGELELVSTVAKNRELTLVEVSPNGESFIVAYAGSSADFYRTSDLLGSSR